MSQFQIYKDGKWVPVGFINIDNSVTLDTAQTITSKKIFTNNINVSKGTTAGSSSTIELGIKPESATMQADIGTDVNGAVIMHATENTGYAFRIGSEVNRFYLVSYGDGIALKCASTSFGTYNTTEGAKWLGNANTATKLFTARTINGVAFDGSKNITVPENVQYSTTDLTAGTSSLATGRIYCVYE